MVEFADHQQYAHRLASIVKLPLHAESLSDVFEAGFQLSDVAFVAIVETKHRPHEKFAAQLIVELRHLTDVASVACEVGGHCRNDAGSRRAADFENEMVFFMLHGQSSEVRGVISGK
ncbi:hypothetical protein D9M73_251020 [compost metagenome]